MMKNKLNIFLVILTLISCAKKELETNYASSVLDLTCPQNLQTCFSPESFSQFKMIGNDIEDNLASLSKVAQKHKYVIINSSESYLRFSNNEFLFEIFISSDSSEFKIRAQKRNSHFMDIFSDSPTQLMEKIKFDFFQKNY